MHAVYFSFYMCCMNTFLVSAFKKEQQLENSVCIRLLLRHRCFLFSFFIFPVLREYRRGLKENLDVKDMLPLPFKGLDHKKYNFLKVCLYF